MENIDIKDLKIVVGVETSEGFGISQFIGFQNILSISKTGSLKIGFKHKPLYISLEYIDTYKIKSISYAPVLFFSKDFDLNQAGKILKEFRVKAVIEHIEYYQNLKLKYEKPSIITQLGMTTQLSDTIFEHPAITTPID